MDEGEPLPEDRFNALLGRALRWEDRERLAKVRSTLGIRANDAVWDVMIALDYHLQLYSAVPKQVAAEREKLVGDLRAMAGALGCDPNGSPGKVGGSIGSRKTHAWPSFGQATLLGAVAVAFGAICVAAGYAMAARGPHPWGAAGPLGALLGAPAGWLIFLLLLPVASTRARAGWSAARSRERIGVRVVGWALLAISVGLVATGLAVLAVALRRP